MDHSDMQGLLDHIRAIKDESVHVFRSAGTTSFGNHVCLQYFPWCILGPYWEIATRGLIIHAPDYLLKIEADHFAITGSNPTHVEFSDWELVK